MNPGRPLFLGILLCFLGAACSERKVTDARTDSTRGQAEAPRDAGADQQPEVEAQPDAEKITEDSVAFLRATRVITGEPPPADCPECPPVGSEALSFRKADIETVACVGETCTATLVMRATFLPATGQSMAGGLTGWIPPGQRQQYLAGQVPSEEQTFRVRITYRRVGGAWRAVEFDRASSETAIFSAQTILNTARSHPAR